MRFEGETCGRKWECDEDVSAAVEDCESPIRAAFECACCMVESENAAVLAEVKIERIGGKMRLSAECEGSKWAANCGVCELCGQDTFQNAHPFNGCEKIVVEEIMNQ